MQLLVRVSSSIDVPTESDDEQGTNSEIWIPTGIVLGLVLPNIIVLLARKVRQEPTAPFATVLASLCLNIGHGLMISRLAFGIESDRVVLIVMIAFYGLWGLLQVIGLIAYGCCHAGNCSAICELWNERSSAANLIGVIRANRRQAPDLTVHAKALHIETRQVADEYAWERIGQNENRNPNDPFSHMWMFKRRYFSSWERADRGGGHFLRRPGTPRNRIDMHTESRRVVTWTQDERFHYESWEEEGEPVRFPNVMSVRIIFTTSLVLDREAAAQLESLRQALRQEGRRHDTTVELVEDVDFPELVDEIDGTLKDGELERHRRTWGGPLGSLLWMLAWLTGYQAVIECFNTFSIADMEILLVKSISGNQGMRARFLEPDRVAGERAIHAESFARLFGRDGILEPLSAQGESEMKSRPEDP
jgi:hypothetical protein